MTEQFSAQDPALGYLFQIQYALWLLLEAGRDGQEIEIAIEKLDDIDIKKDGNEFQLVQTKHHRVPDFLTNASPDLWKTIRIWCSNFKKKKFELENTILTIVTTGIAPEGSIANMLRPSACGFRDTEAAVEKLIDVANTSENQTNLSAYTIFKSLSKEEQILLVDKIQVIDASSTIIDLRHKIMNILIYSARKEYVEAVYEHIIGRWFELVITHLYEKSSNTVSPRKRYVSTGRLAYWPYRMASLHIIFTMKQYKYISHKLLINMIDDIREQYYKDLSPLIFLPQHILTKRIWKKIKEYLLSS